MSVRWGTWLTDKEHRDRLAFVGGGLATLALCFWTVFVYFDGKKLFGGSASPASVTFRDVTLASETISEVSKTVVIELVGDKTGDAPVVDCRAQLDLDDGREHISPTVHAFSGQQTRVLFDFAVDANASLNNARIKVLCGNTSISNWIGINR